MDNLELYEVLEQMIERFEDLADIQSAMQYELVDAKFTEHEVKSLIFALGTLKAVMNNYTINPDCQWK